MSNLNKYLIVAIIALALGVFLHVEYPSIHHYLIKEPDYKPFNDSIKKYRNEIKIHQLVIDSLKSANDSLIDIKNKTNIIYREKLVFIYTANIDELDSIIRSNLK